MSKPFTAWAITTTSPDRFLRRSWWFNGEMLAPMQFSGYRTALWRTRSEARQHVKAIRETFPYAKPVKVHVNIQRAT
jgi:hypothetical protein